MRKVVRPIRGMIYNKFDTQSDFAEYIGWDRRELSKITNGAKQPDIQEIEQIATGLAEPREIIVDIFLQHWSPNGQQKQSIA